MSYNEMSINNTGVCNYDNETQQDIFEGESTCLFALTDIKDNAENKWHFRCKDLAGNANQQGYKFTLKGTSKLNITDKKPTGSLYTNSPTIEVKTSGGLENGKATCNFKLGNFAEAEFFSTRSNIHRQPLTNMSLGYYTFDLRCIDDAGNQAYDSLMFSIDLDSAGPGIK